MDQNSAFQLRSGTRNNAAMPDTNPHAYEDLADWLQEVAARPWDSGSPSIPPGVLPGRPNAGRESRTRRHLQKGRDLVALAALTIAYLQYYYLDVMVQVHSLPQVVVFVPLAAA